MSSRGRPQFCRGQWPGSGLWLGVRAVMVADAQNQMALLRERFLQGSMGLNDWMRKWQGVIKWLLCFSWIGLSEVTDKTHKQIHSHTHTHWLDSWSMSRYLIFTTSWKILLIFFLYLSILKLLSIITWHTWHENRSILMWLYSDKILLYSFSSLHGNSNNMFQHFSLKFWPLALMIHFQRNITTSMWPSSQTSVLAAITNTVTQRMCYRKVQHCHVMSTDMTLY